MTMISTVDVMLLVEDDENDIIITKRKIARSSVPIGDLKIAKNLSDAKDILSKQHIDIILLDLNLPDSQGINTLESILDVYDGIIIVLTSIDDTLIGIEAIRKGADEFLVKSQLDEKELCRAIYFSIERRKTKAVQNRLHTSLDKLEKIVTGATDDNSGGK